MASTLLSYLPVFVLLGAGYAIGRFLHYDRSTFANLLHYILIPAYLFHALAGGLRQQQIMWIIALGAILAIVGIIIVNAMQQNLNQRINSASSIANIALFSLPILTLTWNIKANLRMGLALTFIGMALMHIIMRDKKQSLSTIIRQPWLYAIGAAALVRYGVIPRSVTMNALGPLSNAAIAVSLIYLGTLLSEMKGLGRKDVWYTIATRLVIGLVVGLVFTKLAPVPGYMHTTLIIGAMAPPATLGLAMMSRKPTDGNDADPQLISVALLATLVVYIIFPFFIRYIL